MSKRTRLIILFFCALCFLVISPVLIFYSMGYRFDFEKMKVMKTGGIYVRTFPTADQISIDSGNPEKPGFLANSVFVQSLLPKTHTVLIKKEGYFDYNKTLQVQEQEVTKLENVLLFKKDLLFNPLSKEVKSPFLPPTPGKFSIKDGNLYYTENPVPATLTASAKKPVIILKNVQAFAPLNNNIVWLGTDGFLYQFSETQLITTALKTTQTVKTPIVPEKLTLEALKINKKGAYKIVSNGQSIFLNNDSQLLFYNSKAKDFDIISANVTDAKISPDGYNLAYSSAGKIYLYTITVDANRTYLVPKNKTLLSESKSNITDLFWLNNDYVVFALGDKIMISEIDYRGSVNTVTLSKTTNSKPIFFSRSENKLYVQDGKTILLSEKLIP